MFDLVLDGSPRIEVASHRHRYAYATDGSLPNPLESTYAALAGCAGVYARKACRELGVDEAGIAISTRVVASAARPLMPERVVTVVDFPDRFDEAQRAAVRAAVAKCAVKTLLAEGARIEFVVEEAAPA
ncbi:MAG TPA: OsmC family protein [Steroidobacteraceae bacterium]|nr:OsmC family protein [Steroidobacteraceae bacterium]